jgi:hypothetical protein
MSEYQYYEFLAIDKPLEERAMRELRAITSRADITPTSLINTYHWGDFKGDEWELMEKYFDAFVYVANWGTNRLMLRLPRGLLDLQAASAYACDDGLTIAKRGNHVILEFVSEEEPDGWVEGEGWMSSLAPLRNELMAGDLRCLYLGWLMCAQHRLVEEGVEPPVPPGLAKLSGAQRRLVDFLRVDADLLTVAAKGSRGAAPAGPSQEQLAEWVRAWPEAEKTAWLLRLVEEEGPHLRAELLRAFHEAHRPAGRAGPGTAAGDGRRTVEELLDTWEAFAEEERRREAERQERERRHRAEMQARARANYLDSLSGREDQLWRQVEQLIATKQPKHYDEAVQILTDLRDLVALATNNARNSGRRSRATPSNGKVNSLQDLRPGPLAEREEAGTDFRAHLQQLRERHAKKPSLLQRLNRAGLAP